MSRRPDGEREATLEKLHELLQRPRTMLVLINRLGVDRRTVYRYLEDLEAEGVHVARVGLSRPTKYKAS